MRSKPLNGQPRKQWDRKPRKPIRKIANAKARKMRTEYYPAREAYLSKRENSLCHVCICVSLDMEHTALVAGLNDSYEATMTLARLAGAKFKASTEVHHKFGRAGKNLSDPRGFVASCFGCREWPHENTVDARRLKLLGTPHQYNTPIDRHTL